MKKFIIYKYTSPSGKVYIGQTSRDINVREKAHVYAANKDYVDNLSAKVGTIIVFPANSTPTGFLECNGALISRTSYANLFAVIGTTYGAGDGNTNFAIPDLRGEFIRGFDNGRGIDSGRTLGTQQGYDWKGFYMMNTGQNTYNYNHGEVYHGKSTTGYIGNTFVGGWSAPAAALGTKWDTSEIRPRNVAMMYCIKY